jgi:hypothetical protein
LDDLVEEGGVGETKLLPNNHQGLWEDRLGHSY